MLAVFICDKSFALSPQIVWFLTMLKAGKSADFCLFVWGKFMNIGVPKEIKNHEYRVGMTPESVAEATRRRHAVFVESGAGVGIG
jgi:uncharacterized membrane protein YdfJ with MMPL/SSD domain